MKYLPFLSLVLVAALSYHLTLPADIFYSKNGKVAFESDAPLELIEADNGSLGIVLNRSSKTIAAQVPITSFLGFNNDLQKEHFNENYMESDQFPKAIFKGKIIEDVDLFANGSYKVRVKGMLDIHGEEKERIIPGKITVTDNAIKIESAFEVELADHDISIPRIVTQKIAESVQVTMSATLLPKD